MLFRFRVYRSPLAAEASAAGTMTVDSPAEQATETATPTGAAGKAADARDPKSAPKPEEGKEDAAKAPEAANQTDWDAYQKMQAKFEKNPNARATKRELALREKYDGKDEKLIEGWTPQDKPQSEDDESPAAADSEEKATEEKPKPPPIPKELEDLIGEKSPLKVKNLAELSTKVKGMMQTITRLNGDFGAVGRIMQEAGVENLQKLHGEVRASKRLHALVEDLKAGRAEALKFMGWDKGVPFARPAREAPAGNDEDLPSGVLDEALAHHTSAQLRAANDKIAKLESALNDRFRDVDQWKQTEQQRAAATQRSQQVNDVIKDVSTLVQTAEGLWDPKKHGSLNRALEEYYGSKEGDPVNPGLERIIQILDIAKKHRLDDLDIAYAYWARQNSGNLIREAREQARQPFTGKQPSVGLSDQQGNRNGQFKEFTRQQVQNMGKPGYPRIPSEWTDESGTFIPSKVPAYARPWLFGDPEE